MTKKNQGKVTSKKKPKADKISRKVRDMHELIEAINTFKYSWRGVNFKFNEDLIHCYREQCEQLSYRISLFLPINVSPSLCEIDDLILPNCDQLNDDTFRLQSEKDLLKFADVAKSFYDNLLKKSISDPVFIGPLTQLLETTSSVEVLKAVMSQGECLIKTWNLNNACLALRAMRAALDMSKQEKHPLKLSPETIAWLYKIRTLPQPNFPEKRRIASWMRRQSDVILCHHSTCLESFEIRENIFSAWMLDPSDVSNLLEDNIDCYSQLDHLYSFFMSSNDESQRVKLIEYFIMGCLEMYERETQSNKAPIVKEMANNVKFLCYMRRLVESYWDYFISVVNDPDRDANWKEIEKFLRGYRSEPYLSESSGGFTGVRIWEGVQGDHGVLTPLSPDLKSEDLTIEKHIFFDTFLNRLELMNILQSVFWKTAEIFQMETFPDDHETMIFCMSGCSYSPRCRITGDILKHKSTSVNKSKWFEFLMRLCPILYFPRAEEHYADDLLKALRGKDIDEEILKELNFAANNVPK